MSVNFGRNVFVKLTSVDCQRGQAVGPDPEAEAAAGGGQRERQQPLDTAARPLLLGPEELSRLRVVLRLIENTFKGVCLKEQLVVETLSHTMSEKRTFR
jgi:hypothetical protein